MTTYGKGVIQELHQLTDGSGLKITTNEYFTPNRTKIHKVGIDPDEVIDLDENIKDGENIKDILHFTFNMIYFYFFSFYFKVHIFCFISKHF